MSSPGLSSGTPKAADVFEGLWRQLGECHQNALRELEAKVGKLKKERCLDAQSLEVFHNRNQQLKEQNKTLQHALSLLEERLRGGECDRCAVLEENLKNNQDQSLRLIAKLKNERNSLEDENIKLHAELQKLKMSRSELQQPSSPEQEEGFIPDSPILPSSLPVVNKLKKRRNIDKIKRVRYAEIALPQSNNSLFSELNKEPVGATKNPGRAEVLVPNTCELDAFQISNDANQNLEEEVAETCGLELLEKPHMKTETSRSTGQQSRSKSPWKNDVHLKPYCSSLSSTLIHSPDSTTERSPSLLPRVKRFSEESSFNKAKRKKEESEEEDKQGNQEGVDKETEGKHIQPELIKRTSTPLNNQSFKKEPLHIKVQSAQNDTANQRPNVSCISPAFKKPNVRREANKGGVGKRGNPLQDLSASHDQHEGEDGLGGKANDSLDMMFDTTAYGEYKSCNGSHLGHSQPCDDEDDDEEEEEEEEGNGYIKEEKNPQARSRRRQPFNALFSPNKKQQED
uniref:DNA endonuclease RBBP8 n=1 Tax=Dicentrarchus labrax TaxID=13489 RepID=E6ZIB8_DICLA|nr:Retinoblastoma-binding protein 8 [Dicentrarchus labrax]